VEFQTREKKKGKSRPIDATTFLYCFHLMVQFVDGTICDRICWGRRAGGNAARKTLVAPGVGMLVEIRASM